MAAQKLDRAHLAAFEARLQRLTPERTQHWGSLTPHALLAHLRFTFDLSLGIEEKPDKSIPLVRTLAYYAFFRLFTRWPGGKIKAPAYFTPVPARPFDEEKAAVIEKMRQFVEAAEVNPHARFVTPYLGAVPLHRWQYIHGAHTAHHLRQFGL